MQDTRTGEFHEVDADLARTDPEAAGEKAGIPRKHQGLVVHVGAEVLLNGYKFRVASFGRRFLNLESVAGNPPMTKGV